MTTMDYATLTAGTSTAGSIKRWVNYDQIDPDEILTQATSWLNKRVRVHRQHTRASLTLTQATSSIELDSVNPALHFLDPIRAYLRGFGRLDYRHEDDLDGDQDVDEDGTLEEGAPAFFYIVGRTMHFNTQADQPYTVLLTYYKGAIPLDSSSNTTNLFTQHYPELYQFALMAFAYVFMKDEARAKAMFGAAQEHIDSFLVTDDMMRRAMQLETEMHR